MSPITDVDSESRSTGKERDAETGLDYLGARYYGSNLGRFLTPDWADKPTPVPYAELADPQSLNLYGYVRNNPLSRADRDGHLPCSDGACDNVNVTAEVVQKPKLVKNKEIRDVNGKVVAKATGIEGKIRDTVTVNGKPQSDVKVGEQNQTTTTVNGKQQSPTNVEGKATTNRNGQLEDTVGVYQSTSGGKEANNAIGQAFSSNAVDFTTRQTLTLSLPDGTQCTATSSRTLSNVGTDGKGSSQYRLTTTQPVVTDPNQ